MKPSERATADQIVLAVYSSTEQQMLLGDLEAQQLENSDFEAILDTLLAKRIIEMPAASNGLPANPMVRLTNKGLGLCRALEANTNYLNNYKVITSIRSLGLANAKWKRKRPFITPPLAIKSDTGLLLLLFIAVVLATIWIISKIGLL